MREYLPEEALIDDAVVADDELTGKITARGTSGIYASLRYRMALAWRSMAVALEALRFLVLSAIPLTRVATGPYLLYMARQFRWNPDGDNGAGSDYELARNQQTKQVSYVQTEDVPASAYIVTLATYKEYPGFIVLYLAKGDASNRQPLSQQEKLAVREYINRTARLGGQRVLIASEEPDEITIQAVYEYYPNYGDQELNVAAAEADYVANGITEDGYFVRNDLEARVRALPGIRNYWCTLLQRRPATSAILINIDEKSQLFAGYCRIGTATHTAIPTTQLA